MEPRLEHLFFFRINQSLFLQPIEQGIVFKNLSRMDYISKIQYLFCSFLFFNHPAYLFLDLVLQISLIQIIELTLIFLDFIEHTQPTGVSRVRGSSDIQTAYRIQPSANLVMPTMSVFFTLFVTFSFSYVKFHLILLRLFEENFTYY